MKRLIAIGDSITHGTCNKEPPFGLVEENFIKIIADALGYEEVFNYGVNGTTICSDTSWRPTLAMCRYIGEMFPGDLAIIAGGTNDYGANVEIGKISDEEENTFYGALKILYTKALQRYKDIIVITPSMRQSEVANAKGYTLDDYRNAIKEVAKTFSLKVLDGSQIPFDLERDIPDGLHPNSSGHRLYADWVLKNIK